MSAEVEVTAPSLLEEGRSNNLSGPTIVATANGSSISQLQHVLKLAHSLDVADQQKAAIELSNMVEGSVFPAVSFAPMAHALTRLLPSDNRTVAYYSARAVKTLLLDDALRGQALLVGLPSVLLTALTAWQEEAPCLREILASIQTLTWDKYAIKSIIKSTSPSNNKAIPSAESATAGPGEAHSSTNKEKEKDREDAFAAIVALLETRDQEVLLMTMAIVANICSYSDTFLLTHEGFLDAMTSTALPSILKIAQTYV